MILMSLTWRNAGDSESNLFRDLRPGSSVSRSSHLGRSTVSPAGFDVMVDEELQQIPERGMEKRNETI